MSESQRSKVGAVILAAGASRRLRRPKQLLPWQGQPLVRHTAQTVLASQAAGSAIVLGYLADDVRQALGDTAGDLQFLENRQWQEGQSTSVLAGLSWAQDPGSEPAPLDGVIFIPVDQPFLTTQTVDRLIDAHRQSPDRLIVPHYRSAANPSDGRRGAPVLWPSCLWHHLEELSGDTGGRRLIQALPNHPLWIEDPIQGMDIDTEEDWARLSAPARDS